MGGSCVCQAGGGVGMMVCKCVWWSTVWFGVDWVPMDIIGGIAGGAASVCTLGGRADVCTRAGDSGGTGRVGCGASLLGSAGEFSLRAGWVWCGR